MKRSICLLLVLILLVSVLTGCATTDSKYQKALTLLSGGNYAEAGAAFEKLYGYGEASKLAVYCKAAAKGEAGEYEEAFKGFAFLGDYKDSPEMIKYYQARQLETEAESNEGYYPDALDAYREILLYRDSETRVSSIINTIETTAAQYANAGDFYNAAAWYDLEGKTNNGETQSVYYLGRYYEEQGASDASAYFTAVLYYQKTSGWQDADSRSDVCLANAYNAGKAAHAKKDYDTAEYLFAMLNQNHSAYQDTATLVQQVMADRLYDGGDYAAAWDVYALLPDAYRTHTADYDAMYQSAESLRAAGQFDDALALFSSLGGYRDSAARCVDCSKAILEREYQAAVALMNAGKYEEAITAFKALGGYSDSAAKCVDCSNAILEREYQAAVALMNAGKYDEAITAFKALGGYRDSAAKCVDCSNAILEREYQAAVALMNAGKYDEAITAFKALGGYRDSAARIVECSVDSEFQDVVALLDAGKYEEAVEEFTALVGYRDSAARITECTNAILDREYQAAVKLMNAGKYEEAVTAFAALNGYSDSAAKITECTNAVLERDYQAAVKLMKAGKYEDAVTAFAELNGYSDSAAKITECKNAILERDYQAAVKLMNEGKYDEAITAFRALNQSGNSADGMTEVNDAVLERIYQAGVALMNAGKYEEAVTAFAALNGYSDSITKITECNNAILERDYQAAVTLMNAGSYEKAITAFTALNGYSDSEKHLKECKYQLAGELNAAGKYSEAYALYAAISGYKDVDNLVTTDPNLAAAKVAQFRTVGNNVTYGSYPQGANGEVAPIEWIVLDVQGDKALLISKYGLDAQPYNTKSVKVTWETCTLRAWLNSTFLNTAFTEKEQKAIAVTKVDNSKGQCYSGWSTKGGKNTEDRIFQLSYAEANRYFGVVHTSVKGAKNNLESRVAPTAYAVKQGSVTSVSNKTAEGTAAVCWWLRSPGINQSCAALVLTDGSLYYGNVLNEIYVARPAFWLDTSGI